MALFSDMLPYLLQQQALPGGPNLGPPIAKSPNNVTALNMPSAKLPGTMDFLNSANNFSNVMGENMLRQQQAHLSNLQAQNLASQLALRPEFAAYARSLTNPGQQSTGIIPTGGGDVGSPLGTGAGATGGGGGARVTSSDTADTSLPPEARALLDTIAGPESGGAYNVRFSGKGDQTFSDMSAHPQIHETIPAGMPYAGSTSDAAGRYQFLSSTYNPLGMPDFQPKTQDQAAWKLANQTYAQQTGRDLLTDLKAGKTGEVADALKGQWSTLRGAMPAYSKNLDKYQKQSQQTAAAPQPDNINTPTPPVGGQPPEGANMVYDPASKTMIDATTGRGLGEIAPSAPGSEEEPKEGDQSALTPAGAAIAAGMNKQANLSPRDQLNQALLAQLGGGQVAGDNAAPSGQFGAGNAIPQAMSGQFPALPSSAMGVRGANLSAPFNPAAQAVASPSPTVPSAPQGGPKPPASAAPAMPAPMPGGQPGFQMDPMQAKIIQLGIMGRLSGMGDIATPLEQAFYNSPAFAAAKAAATTGATHTAAFPFIAPEATAKAQADAAVKLQTEPGIQAAIERAKAPAATQGLFDALQKADPGSMEANALTAQILKQGGLKMVFGGERPGSPVWRINPQTFLPEMVASSPVYANKGQVDSSGNQYGGYNFAPLPPTSLNPRGTPAQFQPTAMTGIGPLTVKSLDTQGELEQKGRQANIDAGGGAQQQQAQLAVMKQSAANFYQGPWADSVQNAASILRVLPGIKSDQLDEAVASRSTFDKNAGAFLRQAVHDTSPRAAVQEFKLIGANLPNPDMSPIGLQRVLDEYMGFNDYRIAKAQAQSQWEGRAGARTPSGDVTGFETDWQNVVSPYAFMVARMSDADRSKLFQQVGQTAEGRAEIAHLNDQWQYIASHNLNKNLQ